MKKVILFIFLVSLLSITSNGQTIELFNANSAPPPLGYTYTPKKSTSAVQTNVELDVPVYIWSHGCASTAASMIIAYYDRNGFDCLYRGAIDNGVAPKNNGKWKPAHFYHSDNTYTVNYNNSISASKDGFDGRTSMGHVDAFWFEMNSNVDPRPYTLAGSPPFPFEMDPSIIPGRDHCVGDFMGTNQQYWNNIDGQTTFFMETSEGLKLFDYRDSENLSAKNRRKDGIAGLRDYIEDQTSYSVVFGCEDYITGDHKNCNYSQVFDFEHENGFTFEDFKYEIDNGRPLLVHFYGHTTCGVGYQILNDGTEQIRINDTWQDKEEIWLDWGEDFAGMPPHGVSVIQIYGFKKSGGIGTPCQSIVVGINDYVKIEEPPVGAPFYMPNTYSFSLGSQLSYYALFYDVEEPSYATNWHWRIELFHEGGTYTLFDKNLSGPINIWQPICPAAIPNYQWSRNDDGSVFALLTLICKDSDGYSHEDKKYMSINGVPPNSPSIKMVSSSMNSISIQYSTPENCSYKIYYGNNLYGSYSSTHAHQGSSPISAGTVNNYTLSNLNNGDVIRVTSTDENGESSYSVPIVHSNYSTLPYSTGFESVIDNCWTLKSDKVNGSLIRSAGNGHSGSYGLTMGVTANGAYVQNYADLHIDLSSSSEVVLDFWWKDFNDEFQSGKDALWLSDDGGVNFIKAIDLDGTKYSAWQFFKLSLSELAKDNYLTLSKFFVIRFGQYDNAIIPSDGFAIDDISVHSGIFESLESDAELFYNLNPSYQTRNSTNYGDYPLLFSGTWTNSGFTTKNRALLNIDLSNIPSNNVIIRSAKISLHSANPQPSTYYKHYSFSIMQNSGYKSNASYLKRVTQSWDEQTVTWNNQPTTTSTNQVILPESDFYTQDYENVDITNLVRDLYTNQINNSGLMLQLQSESYYSQMSFASSDHTVESLRPKVEIDYDVTPTTMTLKLNKDANLNYNANPSYSYFSSTNYGTYNRLQASEWTNSGYRTNAMGIFDFDLSALGQMPVIISAKLKLYACDPQPWADYKQMSNLSTGSSTYKSNASLLRRVTTPWEEHTVTYDNKPEITTQNQVYLPISGSYTQNYLDINVTAMVKDMINDPLNSYGFMLQLDNEIKYSNMTFASSDHANSALHPSLIIEYVVVSGSLKKGELNDNSEAKLVSNEANVEQNLFTIYPNPATDNFYIETDLNDYKVEIYDISGRLINQMNGKNKAVFNCANWSEGTYLVKIIKDLKIENKLIMIVK